MTWQLDPTHSSIEFAVKHMLVATVKGRFEDFDINAEVDESDLARSTAVIRIQATSVDTRTGDRDNHLRSPDLFDVANHPEITFVSRKIESLGGSTFRFSGDLSIRGVTREVVLEGEMHGPWTDPWGGTRVGLSAEGRLNRKDFGLTWNGLMEAGGVLLGDDVKVTIDAELLKAA